MPTLDDKITAWESGAATSCGYGPDGPCVTIQLPGGLANLTLREVADAYKALKTQHEGEPQYD